MMVREFQPLDLHRIVVARVAVPGWRDHGAKLLASGPCWSAVHDGEVIACAGLALHWPGRAGAWCLIGARFPRSGWIWLHRQVSQGLAKATADLRLRRIEAEAAYGWPPGARWLGMLGFEREGVMRAFGHGGEDFERWARIAGAAATEAHS